MFSGDHPFRDIVNEFQVPAAVKRGRRPSRPSRKLCRMRGLEDEIWRLMENCWSAEPLERPTSNQIVERLRALLSEHIN